MSSIVNPPVEFGEGIDAKTGDRIILIGNTQCMTASDIVRTAPQGVSQQNAGAFAKAVNYLACGTAFRVIEAPQDYENNYRCRIATEDPSRPWTEGVMRLCDFGTPEFLAIEPPKIADRKLSFYAEDVITALPYVVHLDFSAESARLTQGDYAPMPLL